MSGSMVNVQKEEEKSEDKSDSEDAVSPWAMRRREASDDENGDGSEREIPIQTNLRSARVVVLGELARLGVAPKDDDDKEGWYIYELAEGAVEEDFCGGGEDCETGYEEEEDNRRHPDQVVEEEENNRGYSDHVETVKQRKEEQEREAVAVSKIGAFYIDDDRFAVPGSCCSQRFNRKNLREFKDQERWKHDKFEEMTLKETNKERKTSDVRYHGQHNIQGREANVCKLHDDHNKQSQPSRIVKGRGHIKYRPMSGNNANLQVQNNQLRDPFGITQNIHSVKVTRCALSGNRNADLLTCRKYIGSNTSSAMSSTGGVSPTKKMKFIHSRNNRCFTNSVQFNSSSCMPQSNACIQGNIIADSIWQDMLYHKGFTYPIAEHHVPHSPFISMATWSTFTAESPQLTGQYERGFPFSTGNSNQLTPTFDQVNRVSPLTLHQVVPPMPFKSSMQPPVQVHDQQFSRYFHIGSQAPFALTSSPAPGILESLHGSCVPFLHNGSDITGTQGVLLVMQLEGQQHGSIVYPAADAAFTIAQTQVGLEKSEIACSMKNTGKPISGWKHPERNEYANDASGQQQGKIRRYSQMNFNKKTG